MPTERDERRADQVSRGQLADLARRMMDRYNHGLRDPSVMAVNGHDTTLGYEFFVQEDGRIARFTVEWDMAD